MSEDTNVAVIGTYTREGGDGLVSCDVSDPNGFERLDTAAETNPSFLALHPTESIVVAVNEVEEGSAVSYDVDDDGSLTYLDGTDTGDAGPCHVAIDPRGSFAVVSHYVGGSVALLPVDGDGTLSRPIDRRDLEGSSVHPERQTAPHPHSAHFVTEDLVYVPDLGTDRLYVYELDRDAGQLRPGLRPSIELPAGSGPRHMEVHPTEPVGYLLNELDATLQVLDLTDPTRPTVHGKTSTLPGGVSPEGTIAADVHVHPDGSYVVTTNRGDDSLATFDVGNDALEPERIAVTSCGGEWPRHFAFASDGARLFACNQHSDAVVPFTVDRQTGALSAGTTQPVAAPVCFVEVTTD